MVSAQSGDLRSVEEVIRNIDDLLGEYDQDFEFQGDEPTARPEAVNSYSPPPVLNPQLIPQNSRQDPIQAIPSEQPPSFEGSYRLENELMPENYVSQ